MADRRISQRSREDHVVSVSSTAHRCSSSGRGELATVNCDPGSVRRILYDQSTSMAGTTAVFRSACTGPVRLANDEGGLRYARGVHRSAGTVRRLAPGKIAPAYALGAFAWQCGPFRGGETFPKLGPFLRPERSRRIDGGAFGNSSSGRRQIPGNPRRI